MFVVATTIPLLRVRESSQSSTDLYRIPSEWDIDRRALVDISPDREDLLLGGSPIEEIRQALKLRVTSSSGHWLYCAQRLTHAKLSHATTSLSLFERLHAFPTSDQVLEKVKVAEPGSASLDANARVFSPYCHSRVVSSIDAAAFQIWSSAPLSTEYRLVSPRPLEATHIIIAYPLNDTSFYPSGSQALRSPLTPTITDGLYIPVNDLLFMLSAPNLVTEGYRRGHPTFPRRLHSELPHVMMPVPHLDTFSELVVYLHTKNQAELFRRVIPEWIRDLIHPLPPASAPQTQVIGSGVAATLLGKSFKQREKRYLRKLFSDIVKGSRSRKNSLEDETDFPAGNTLQLIAVEVALVSGDLRDPTNCVAQAAVMLDALADNLAYIGYFGKELWQELDTYRDILRRSISYRAKLDEQNAYQAEQMASPI